MAAKRTPVKLKLPSMVLIECWIKGTRPMLQHRFSDDAEEALKATTRRVKVKIGTPREEAEKVVYRDDQGNIYMLGAWVEAMLKEVGSNHKQKGNRKSLKYIMAAAAIVNEETILLYDEPPNGAQRKPKVLKEFEVDSRPVVIPSTKGRVMRHRPRLDKWAACFTVQINEDIIDSDTIHQLMAEGGVQNGLGDYRIQKGGRFGSFAIVSWKEINAS